MTSLKTLLFSALTMDECFERLEGALTSEQLKSVEERVASFYNFCFPSLLLDDAESMKVIAAMDKEWSELPNELERALLSLKVTSVSSFLLPASLITKLPPFLIVKWASMVRFLNNSPMEAIKLFVADDAINSELVFRSWCASNSPESSLVRLDSGFAILVTQIYFEKTVELDTGLLIQFMHGLKAMREAINETFPTSLTIIEQSLLAKYKEETGLVGVPDEWIREVVNGKKKADY